MTVELPVSAAAELHGEPGCQDYVETVVPAIQEA